MVRGREISELIDSFAVSYNKNGYTYSLEMFKEGKPLQLLKENDVVTSVLYCPSYFSSNPTYTIEIRNFRMEEILCDFSSMDFKCNICNSRIFPIPDGNCEHIAFIYVKQEDGLWAYANEKVKSSVNMRSQKLNMDEFGKLCDENHWDMRIYIDTQGSTDRPLIVLVGGILHEI